jgi:glycosyltransferase involved in cell wall biosynthesis
MELARGLGRSGIKISLATMGRHLSRCQREELRGIPEVRLFESTYKLEWMDDPWEEVKRAGEWLLDLEGDEKPDVIHLNGYVHAALPFRARRLVVGHSCVLSWWRAVLGTTAPGEWDQYRRAVIAGLRAADLVVAPSQTMLLALQEHYGPLAAVKVISNGRDYPSDESPAKSDLILTAGRLWDRAKNVEGLARVAPELPWPVYCAGEIDSPDRKGQNYTSVQWLGRLSQPELWHWFSRASIYALPARYEPFGLSVLEAALAGCVLVLGDIPSLRELWGKAAFYVSPDDPLELKNVLHELISSRMLRSEMSLRARQAARSFTARRMVGSYITAYRSLLNPHSAGNTDHEMQNSEHVTHESQGTKHWAGSRALEEMTV